MSLLKSLPPGIPGFIGLLVVATTMLAAEDLQLEETCIPGSPTSLRTPFSVVEEEILKEVEESKFINDYLQVLFSLPESPFGNEAYKRPESTQQDVETYRMLLTNSDRKIAIDFLDGILSKYDTIGEIQIQNLFGRGTVLSEILKQERKLLVEANNVYFVVFCARDYVPGHAFVIFGRESEEELVCKVDGAWGFYPKEDVMELKAMFLGTVPGKLVSEYTKKGIPANSVRAIFRVSKTRYGSALATKQKWESKTEYTLLKKNCVAFVADVASSIGIQTPDSSSVHPQRFIYKLIRRNRGRCQLDGSLVGTINE